MSLILRETNAKIKVDAFNNIVQVFGIYLNRRRMRYYPNISRQPLSKNVSKKFNQLIKDT